ncbi:tubulin alpha-8 chain-like isoform X1 [Cimex lectularius]|uniref:Tubulin alpha chain n=1 Tax=Cimex lectularius TaxID=79782 RepID=A0A8I6RMD2_CIMLE|nr:tubulin alpha-8 chain-like isoform X1 [Cimex lectularius]
MREVISVHIGQAGVQIGNNCWELYCIEHGLDASGGLYDKMDGGYPMSSELGHYRSRGEMSMTSFGNAGFSSSHSSCDFPPKDDMTSDGFGSFFMESSDGSYTPRALMVDLEPTVIDEVRTGPYKKLYAPSYLVSGNEDAANNFARGYYTTGKSILERVKDPLIKMAESSDKLQGFMMYHSFGGGTGSGFHSLLSQELSNEFPKLSKIEIAVFPSPMMSTAVVEPYNTVLTNSSTLDNTQCVFLADNEAMYNICQKRLDIDSPNYRNLNRLLAQTVSSITASLRFKGTLNTDFSDFQTNLVPYPKIHFPIMSYAPITSVKASAHETQSVSTMTNNCFDDSHRLMRCPVDAGRYMSCCLLYRGDITPKDVNAAIAQAKLKKTVKFVEWSPTGFKVGLNGSSPSTFPNSDITPSRKAICMMCNSTAIREIWALLNFKFNLMLEKKAFIHWYHGEGMCEQEFYDAQEKILGLEQEYLTMQD